MKNIKYRSYLATVVFTILALASFSTAVSHSMQEESFRGLKGVYVSVERLDPRIEKDGLTDDQVRADVVSQLRLAGIKVLSKKEWFDMEGSPYLYVNANILKLQETEEYVYSVNISLKQNVYPARNAIEISGAATWTMGGVVGITPHLNQIRDSVGSQVKEFIKVYMSANPN